MTINSSNFSSTTNSSSDVSSQELEASAAAVLNRAALGMVKDSIEVSFMQLGGNVWKYDSTASRPVLSPLIQAANTLQKAEDKSWDAFFEELRKNLPSEINERLTREKTKSQEERSPSYVALEEILVSSAKILATIEKAVRAESATSIPAQTALLHLSQGASFAKNTAQLGEQFLVQAKQFLATVGPNYIYHDHLSENIGIAEKALGRIMALLKEGP